VAESRYFRRAWLSSLVGFFLVFFFSCSQVLDDSEGISLISSRSDAAFAPHMST
jgi:hypothetical protein